MNPGPPRTWKNPCGTCQKPVKSNQDGLQCDSCDTWFHLRCLPDAIRISRAEYIRLSQSNENWFRYECQLPTLTDSLFSSATSVDGDTTDDDLFIETSDVSDVGNLFNELRTVRGKCRKNVIISHININININSVRYKLLELSDLFSESLVDILVISETQLDATFTQAQFDVPGFKSFRKDRSAHGGGILVYVRADLPTQQRPDRELTHVESIVIETMICDRKWVFVCAYRPPSVTNATFTNDFTTNIDKLLVHFDNFIVIGDLNYDMCSPNKYEPLTNLCDLFDLSCLVKRQHVLLKTHPIAC